MAARAVNGLPARPQVAWRRSPPRFSRAPMRSRWRQRHQANLVYCAPTSRLSSSRRLSVMAWRHTSSRRRHSSASSPLDGTHQAIPSARRAQPSSSRRSIGRDAVEPMRSRRTPCGSFGPAICRRVFMQQTTPSMSRLRGRFGRLRGPSRCCNAAPAIKPSTTSCGSCATGRGPSHRAMPRGQPQSRVPKRAGPRGRYRCICSCSLGRIG